MNFHTMVKAAAGFALAAEMSAILTIAIGEYNFLAAIVFATLSVGATVHIVRVLFRAYKMKKIAKNIKNQKGRGEEDETANVAF